MNRKLLTAAIASALAAPLAAQAIDFKISGHVNRTIRFLDDGQGSDIQHLDNGASMSRIRFKGSGDLGNGMKVGTYIETAVASSVPSNVGVKAKQGTGDTAFNIRHSALWFSGSWGKLTLGHTAEANDGTATVDMSRTWMADSGTSPAAVAGPVAWRTSAGGTLTSPLCGGTCTVFSTSSTFDGSRRDVLRYDSPAFGPASVAVSLSNNEIWSAGLSVSQDLAGGSLALKGGYSDRDNDQGNSIWAVSGGFKFPQGTSITLQFSGQDNVGPGTNPDRFFVKLGHDWANNGVSVSYQEVNDFLTSGSDLTAWGLGVNHAFPKAGADVYAGYHNFDLDLSGGAKTALGVAAGTGTESMDGFVVGARVKFQ